MKGEIRCVINRNVFIVSTHGVENCKRTCRENNDDTSPLPSGEASPNNANSAESPRSGLCSIPSIC